MTRQSTDWNEYYRNAFPLSGLTRAISVRILLNALRRAGLAERKNLRIAELGAGDSRFAEIVFRAFDCAEYHALDNNAEMLARLSGRLPFVVPHAIDLRNGAPELRADLAYSMGLIEHFDEAGTESVLRAHFRCVVPGGLVAVMQPTPTRSYRTIRFCAERLRIWKFPDERPLRDEEILSAAKRCGGIPLDRRISPIGLTQTLLLFRKA